MYLCMVYDQQDQVLTTDTFERHRQEAAINQAIAIAELQGI